MEEGSSSNSMDTVHFLSENFDPLLALRTLKEIPTGFPKVKPMDSLEKCR
jgi:hypothetical protein